MCCELNITGLESRSRVISEGNGVGAGTGKNGSQEPGAGAGARSFFMEPESIKTFKSLFKVIGVGAGKNS